MYRIVILFFLLTASASAADLKPFDRMDVFELQWVSNPAVSPDGRRIVYNRNAMDVMTDGKTSRLWIMDSNGRNNRPLTGRDVNEGAAAWSPDGTRLAFVSSTERGSEVFVYWIDDRSVARLTQLDRSPGALSWSPSGDYIAFPKLVPEAPPVLVTAPPKPEGAEWAEAPRVTTRFRYEQDGAGYVEPGFTQYFVMPAVGGTARQVTTGSFRHDNHVAWSADGKSLLFSGNRNDDWERNYTNSEIYRVQIDTGDVETLTTRNGPDFNPVVSPDGRHIAYISAEDKVQAYQVYSLHVMNADGSGQRELTGELDRSVSGLVFNRDGVYFQYDHHGDMKIAHVTLSGRIRQVAEQLGGTEIGRPYGVGSFSVSDGGRVAFTHVTPYRPAELAIAGGRNATLLTDYNAPLFAHRELGRVEEIWYPATTDGRDIQGWIVYPPGFDADNEYPLLVENHGGPIANYGPRFSPEMQLYASGGYIVFYPNPRGSTGYGEEFANLLYNNYPGDDYQDVMDGVDVLIERGIAHEGRLYVTGGSAGGIMTAWIIGKNNRFRAAAVIKPVMNWISKTLTADNYFAYADYRYPGQPWENIDGYMKFSPVSLLGNIETPTLVMVGTADMRTPLSEAKQLYNGLKIRDIDTALVEMPGAPHNIAGKPSQLISKIDHILAWFEKYRGD